MTSVANLMRAVALTSFAVMARGEPAWKDYLPAIEVREYSWGSQPEYTWRDEAVAIHRGIREKTDLVDKLLSSKTGEEKALGIFFLSPFVWQGPSGLVPSSRAKSLDIRRAYGAQVERVFTKKAKWPVKVACLVYYFGFPEQVKAPVLMNAVDIRKEWAQQASKGEQEPKSEGFLQMIIDKKRHGDDLGFMSYYVYCQAAPEEAIAYGIRNLQDMALWVVPIAHTRALYSVSRTHLRQIGSERDRKLIAEAMASSLYTLGFGFEEFCQDNYMPVDTEFPAKALRGVLSDKVGGKAFRGMLQKEYEEFALDGFEIDWEKVADKEAIERLEAVFLQAKRQWSEVKREGCQGDRQRELVD